MREIKFRAYKKDFGRMEVHRIDFPSLQIYPTENEPYNYVQDAILMQFTGLKDKNGKDIWEGDIVRRNGNEDLKEISWNETQIAGFAYKDGVFYDGIIEPDDELEIIGNIYENPELLK